MYGVTKQHDIIHSSSENLVINILDEKLGSIPSIFMFQVHIPQTPTLPFSIDKVCKIQALVGSILFASTLLKNLGLVPMVERNIKIEAG